MRFIRTLSLNITMYFCSILSVSLKDNFCACRKKLINITDNICMWIHIKLREELKNILEFFMIMFLVSLSIKKVLFF